MHEYIPALTQRLRELGVDIREGVAVQRIVASGGCMIVIGAKTFVADTMALWERKYVSGALPIHTANRGDSQQASLRGDATVV